MLRVVSLPSGSWFTRFAIDQTWDNDEYSVDDILVGPFSPVNFQVSSSVTLGSYDGVIQNDPLKDRIGDREVFHDQISGQADLPGFPMETVYGEGGYTYVFPVYRTWNKAYSRWERFRHVCAPGFELFYAHLMQKARWKPIQYIKIMWDGKNLLVLTGYRRTEESSYFYARPSYYTIKSVSSSAIYWYHQTGTTLTNESQIADLRPIELTSGMILDTQWVKPESVTYDLQKLKNCFYWLDDQAKDEGKFYPAFVEPNPLDYGDLCQAAIERARAVDVNTLSFLAELRDISTLIPKIGKVKDPKTWANLYLCYKYGALLTLSDTKKLVHGIEGAFQKSRDLNGMSTVRSSLRRGGLWKGLPYTEECRYKITYRPYPNRLMEVVRTLDRWGLYPTLARDWDMIPFSFVLDWVVDVGSALDRLDTHMIADYYDVVGVTRSRKVMFTLPVTSLVLDWPGTGTITLTRYTRDTTPILDLPKVRFDGDEDGFGNWAELTALIISRGK